VRKNALAANPRAAMTHRVSRNSMSRALPSLEAAAII